MVRCARVVVILTEKSTQMHTTNATNQNLRELAMVIRPKTTGNGQNRKLATNSYLNASCQTKYRMQ